MVLKRLFGRSGETEKRKRVTCDELSRYLNIEDDAVWKKEDRRGGVGDFLDGCIKWSKSDGSGIRGKKRWFASGTSIWVRDLDIELEADDCGDVDMEYGRGTEGTVDLSFENCFFTSEDAWTTGIKFIPKFENTNINDSYIETYFIFSKNTSDLDPCSFSFPGFSEVIFSQNDFKEIVVERNIVVDPQKFSEGDMVLKFMGNKFERLDLDFPFPFKYPVKFSFLDNEIDFLNWDEVVCRRRRASSNFVRSVGYDDVQEYSWLGIHFDRNKIISGDRDLFILLRKLAIERKDMSQEKIIDSYISMIEYTEIKKSKWYKTWEGIEKMILLGWRRWSSNFYMSWLRPLVFLFYGYLIFNAIPMLWIDDYSWREWLEFSFLSPKAIYDYAGNLGNLLEPEVTEGDKIGLNVVEWGRWIWIILCGFAVKNVFKKK